MEKPSVLQCCLSTAWGGLEMVAYETAQRLAANGFGVTTACAPDTPLHRELERAGLRALPVVRRHKYFAWGAVRTFREELGRGGYRAVLVHQLNDLWQLVPALRGFPDVRLVGVAHTFVGIDKKDFLHRRLYGRINKLVALTSIHKENLLKHLPLREEQVAILPNSIDTEKFRPERRLPEFRAKYSGFLIGVVSRLDENKGLLETVETAARLRDQNVECRVVIVGKETAGEAGMLKKLENAIADRGLTRQVHLAGHHSDIAGVIASFDVLLLPSPAETFGRVLIEAMACGVPIVASGGGGVPDIIRDGENGLLVRPLDVEEMAKALRRMQESPDLRKQLAQQGLHEARTVYDTKVIQAKLQTLLGI
jgi:glycosyltransferase involved in cell wall biosynthesis